MTVLRKDPLLVGSLRYNRLTEKIDVTKVLWWNKEPCVLTNKGRKALRYFFEKYYGLFNESVMDDALDLEAYYFNQNSSMTMQEKVMKIMKAELDMEVRNPA